MSAEEVQPLFTAVRRACNASTWSRGVELARAEAVSGEGAEGDEVTLRVSTRGGLLCPTVHVYLDDPEWDCDCGSREDVCEHVAGAVIALRQARRAGETLPVAAAGAGRIGYRLSHGGSTLSFERVVVTDGREETLAATLAAVSSGRAEGPPFVATQEDLAVERLLGARRRGELPRGIWHKLVPALAGCPDVTLDGQPVRASVEKVDYVGRVEDREDGFVLRIAPDPRISESLPEELVLLRDGTLCVFGGSQLTGREREIYGRGRFFSADQAAELVSEVLPSLSRRIPLDVRTRRLPRAQSEPPRISLVVEREGDALAVLPTLVYGDPPTARVDGGKLVPLGGALPLRDEAAERALTHQLQQELELLPGRRLSVRGAEAVALAAKIRRFDGEVRGGGLDDFRREAPLRASVALRGDRFEVRFRSGPDAGDGGRSADPARVLRAWRDGESLVPLQGGGFAELPADWLARFGDRIADLLAARDDAGRVARAALPDLAALCAELDEPMPEQLETLRSALEGLESPPPAKLPDDLQASLRHYQQDGVDWLCAARDAGVGALLADDMGLGKTLQALCALRGRTLVVAPTSVLHGWRQQLAQFRPGLSVSTYHGPDRELEDADVTLTTYAILRLDADALASRDWDTLILDESQAIKNPDSQSARAAFRLRGPFRLALTGTPVENRLEELWSQLHFTHPGLLGGRRDFEERYARPIAQGDEAAAARLRARIAPFLLRRTKQQVAPELPPRTEVVVYAELGHDERQVYDAIRALTRKEVLEKLSGGAGIFQALEALLRLRQAACHPSLVPGQHAVSSSKVDLLLDVLGSAVSEGHKALVFSQWTSLLDLVEPQLRRAEIDFLRLDGSTRDRGAVVDGFQREGGPPVLLLSLKAGGTGLNLTAADNVFILDPWWNPAAEDQAADRAHRIGQERPVLVTRLVARDTVEERILALQESKRALARAALADAGPEAALSRDELLDLLA
jgi:superfamily II DNA or RNA helicase